MRLEPGVRVDVRDVRRLDVRRVEVQRAGLGVGVDLHAVQLEQAGDHRDVADLRHVAQHARGLPQQRGHHRLRDEVLGPADRDLSRQRVAPVDVQQIAHRPHRLPPADVPPTASRLARRSRAEPSHAGRGDLLLLLGCSAWPCCRTSPSSWRAVALALRLPSRPSWPRPSSRRLLRAGLRRASPSPCSARPSRASRTSSRPCLGAGAPSPAPRLVGLAPSPGPSTRRARRGGRQRRRPVQPPGPDGATGAPDGDPRPQRRAGVEPGDGRRGDVDRRRRCAGCGRSGRRGPRPRTCRTR